MVDGLKSIRCGHQSAKWLQWSALQNKQNKPRHLLLRISRLLCANNQELERAEHGPGLPGLKWPYNCSISLANNGSFLVTFSLGEISHIQLTAYHYNWYYSPGVCSLLLNLQAVGLTLYFVDGNFKSTIMTYSLRPKLLSVLVGTQILKSLWGICINAQLGPNLS